VDRFLHDILVDVMIDIGDAQFYHSFVGQLMLRLVPKKAAIILFDVDEQISLQRKFDIPSLGYVSLRRKYYHELAQHLGIPKINTDYSFHQVHKILVESINKQARIMTLKRFEKRLKSRLQARIRWKKWKKGPVAFVKKMIMRICYSLFGTDKFIIPVNGPNLDLGVDDFGRDVTTGLLTYIKLLERRGLHVHTLVVVGSRAKGRYHRKSDTDMILILHKVPSGLRRYSLLSDIPYFLGISGIPMLLDEFPETFTTKGFLQSLEELDLTALDAICYGKVLYDAGFWLEAKKKFIKIEEKYKLNNSKLKKTLSFI